MVLVRKVLEMEELREVMGLGYSSVEKVRVFYPQGPRFNLQHQHKEKKRYSDVIESHRHRSHGTATMVLKNKPLSYSY